MLAYTILAAALLFVFLAMFRSFKPRSVHSTESPATRECKALLELDDLTEPLPIDYAGPGKRMRLDCGHVLARHPFRDAILAVFLPIAVVLFIVLAMELVLFVLLMFYIGLHVGGH